MWRAWARGRRESESGGSGVQVVGVVGCGTDCVVMVPRRAQNQVKSGNILRKFQ